MHSLPQIYHYQQFNAIFSAFLSVFKLKKGGKSWRRLLRQNLDARKMRPESGKLKQIKRRGWSASDVQFSHVLVAAEYFLVYVLELVVRFGFTVEYIAQGDFVQNFIQGGLNHPPK